MQHCCLGKSLVGIDIQIKQRLCFTLLRINVGLHRPELIIFFQLFTFSFEVLKAISDCTSSVCEIISQNAHPKIFILSEILGQKWTLKKLKPYG